jgi:hypothetical protein
MLQKAGIRTTDDGSAEFIGPLYSDVGTKESPDVIPADGSGFPEESGFPGMGSDRTPVVVALDLS